MCLNNTWAEISSTTTADERNLSTLMQIPLTAKDFCLGSQVLVRGQRFEMLDADEATLCFYDSNADAFPEADGRRFTTLVAEHLRDKNLDHDLLKDQKDICNCLFNELMTRIPGCTRHQLVHACRSLAHHGQ